MIQPVISPYASLATKTAMSQLGYENYIAKVKVDGTLHSLLIHRSSLFIIEDHQSANYHLLFVNPRLLFPVSTTFIPPETVFAGKYPYLEVEWNICLS